MASFTQFMYFFPFIPFLKIVYSSSLCFRNQLVITGIILSEENFCFLLDGQSSICCRWPTICINIKSCYHIRRRDWTTAQSFGSWLAWWQHTVCLPILQLQTNVKSANTLSMQLMSRKTLKLQKWQLEVGTRGRRRGEYFDSVYRRSTLGVSAAWSLFEHWINQGCSSNDKFIYTWSESVLWIQSFLFSQFVTYL